MSEAVTNSRPTEFTDDSSAALRLNHGAKAPSSEVFDRGGERLPPPGSKLREREIEERKQILAGEQEVWDRDVARSLANLRASDHNATRAQAEAAVKLERRNKQQARDSKFLEHEERKARELRDLMDVDKEVDGSGSRTKNKSVKKPGVDTNALYDSLVSDDGMGPRKETEAERAQRLAEANNRRLETKRGAGPPLKGKEPMMPVSMRLEPAKVVGMHEMTGRNCADLMREFYDLLCLAKTNGQGITLAAAFGHLLTPEERAEAS